MGVEWGGGADRRNRADRRRAARRASDQPREVLVLSCEVGIVAVCSSRAAVEPTLREYFHTQEADAKATETEWPEFTLHGIEIDDDVWYILVTSPGYPDPNEGPAYQYGHIERFVLRDDQPAGCLTCGS